MSEEIEPSPDESIPPTNQDAGSTPPETSDAQERPSFLLDKFKTVEEQAQAYAELEKQLSEATQPDAGNEQEPPAPSQPLPKTLSKFADEFAAAGQLSPESYAELEQKHGLPRNFVDRYIQGVTAESQAYIQAVHAVTGGEEGFSAMNEWAVQNLSEPELVAANEALQSGNKERAALAVRGLYSRYQEDVGKDPALLDGGGTPRSSIERFKSTAEVVVAMSDPRYDKDAAYRKQVEQRLAISDVI